MNILFLTITRVRSFGDRGIYTDLLREFITQGHQVYVACPIERRLGMDTHIVNETGGTILNIKTLNLQKTNVVEKGVGMLTIEYQFLRGIKHYFSNIKFDLIIYATPPITFTKIIKYIKAKDHAKSYLLLKDIFPQNAVDLNMMKENGFLHTYFKKKERQLYKISDHIGCMSTGNVKYILEHHQLDSAKVEVNPNSIDPIVDKKPIDKTIIRKKYKIPTDSVAFIYGGNLGKPQGVDFIISALNDNINAEKMFFLIIGSGTEYTRLVAWFKNKEPRNMLLLNALPKDEYDLLLAGCDVGMIFLDHKFTIPNFPSRLLSYLENEMPVIAATDKATDLGEIIENNHFGKWSIAGDLDSFNKNLEKFIDPTLRTEMGQNAYSYLMQNYQVKHSYDIILSKFKNR